MRKPGFTITINHQKWRWWLRGLGIALTVALLTIDFSSLSLPNLNGLGSIIRAVDTVDQALADDICPQEREDDKYGCFDIPYSRTTLTSFTALTGGTTPGTIQWTFTPGFNMRYYGTTYTQLSLTPNAFLRFGNTIPVVDFGAGYTTNPAPAGNRPPNTAYGPIISMWLNEYDVSDNSSTAWPYNGTVLNDATTTRWQVFGTAPNRTLVVELWNWRHWYNQQNVPHGPMRIQTKFYESSNIIEMHWEQLPLEPCDGAGPTPLTDPWNLCRDAYWIGIQDATGQALTRLWIDHRAGGFRTDSADWPQVLPRFQATRFLPSNAAPEFSGADIPPVSLETANGALLQDIVGGAIVDDLPPTDNIFGVAAVAQADLQQGVWQYATTGANWVAFPANLSESNAVLLRLDSNTRIRFVPDPTGRFTGEGVALSLKAWDLSNILGTSIIGELNPANGALEGVRVNLGLVDSFGNTLVGDSGAYSDDTIEIEVSTNVPLDEFDNNDPPNNDVSSAANIVVPASPGVYDNATLTISPAGNPDYFRFFLYPGDITIRAFSSQGLPLTLTLSPTQPGSLTVSSTANNTTEPSITGTVNVGGFFVLSVVPPATSGYYRLEISTTARVRADQYEENDNRETAFRLDEAINDLVDPTIFGKGDEDWFIFPTEAGLTNVGVYPAENGMSLTVNIYAGSSTTALRTFTVDQDTDPDERITSFSSVEGVYVIKIDPTDDTQGRYRLVTEFEALETETLGPDSFERNNSRDEAREIPATGENTALTTFPAPDPDWFRFWGVAGTTQNIEVFAGSPGVNYSLVLYNIQGQAVQTTSADDNPGILNYPITNTGYYFIGVLPDDPDDTGRYRLLMANSADSNDTSLVRADRFETNDTRLSAKSIDADARYTDLSLYATRDVDLVPGQGDQDYFLVELATAESTFKITSVNNPDILYEIAIWGPLDPTNALPQRTACGKNAQLVYTPTEAGFHAIRIREVTNTTGAPSTECGQLAKYSGIDNPPFDAGQTGWYILDIFNLTSPPTVTVTGDGTQTTPDRFEVNDTFSQAKSISVDTRINNLSLIKSPDSDLGDAEGDVDFYRLELQNFTSEVRLTSVDNPDMFYGLAIYSPSGGSAAPAFPEACGKNPTLTFSPGSAGFFVLRVREVADASCTELDSTATPPFRTGAYIIRTYNTTPTPTTNPNEADPSRPPGTPDRYEVNDTFANAKDIPVDTRLTNISLYSSISNAEGRGDVDFYRLTLQDRASEFRVAPVTNPNIIMEVAIFSVLEGSSRVLASRCGRAPILSFNPSAEGLHVLRIRQVANVNCDPLSAYDGSVGDIGFYTLDTFNTRPTPTPGADDEDPTGPPTSSDRYEVNDTFATASSVAIDTTLRNLSLFTEADDDSNPGQGDVDFYRFSLQDFITEFRLSSVTNPDIFFELALYSPAGGSLNPVITRCGKNPTLTYNPDAAGFHVLRVREVANENCDPLAAYDGSVGQIGFYTLDTFNTRPTPTTNPDEETPTGPPTSGDRFEENDSLVNASVISTDVSFRNLNIFPAGDPDYYRFFAIAGPMTVRTYVGTPGMRLRLSLLGPTGTVLDTAEGTDPQISIGLTSPGYYALLVEESTSPAISGWYDLETFNRTTAPADGDFGEDNYEENDRLATAAEISADVTLNNLTVYPASNAETDFYRFFGVAGPVAVQVFSTNPNMSLTARLISSTGETLATETGQNPTFSTRISSSGFYYIEVDENNGEEGIYRMTVFNRTPTATPPRTPTVTRTPGPTLTMTGTPDLGDGPDSAEINNTFEDSYRIAPGNVISLNFNSGFFGIEDEDFFVMNVTQNVVYTCETQNLGTGTDTMLTAYGPSQSFEQVVANNDDLNAATGEIRSLISWTSGYSGEVYIVVRQKGDLNSPGDASYDLACYTGTSADEDDLVDVSGTSGSGSSTDGSGGTSDTTEDESSESLVPVELLQAPDSIAGVATQAPMALLTLNIVLGFDENANGVLDLAEGISGMSVRAIDKQTNRQLAHGFTDSQGGLQLLVVAPEGSEIRVVIPFLSLAEDFNAGDTEEWEILIDSSPLPVLIP